MHVMLMIALLESIALFLNLQISKKNYKFRSLIWITFIVAHSSVTGYNPNV